MIEIHQAGPMNFIRTLLIIALVYYTLKFLARLFAPYLMKKAVQKMQERFEKQNRANNRQSSPVNLNLNDSDDIQIMN